MFRKFLFGICLFLYSCNSSERDPEAIVNEFIRESRTPGVFVAVVRGDSTLYQQSFGYADRETSRPMDLQTCMELGSISKALTAEMIYALVGIGKLQLDDTITKYLAGAPSSWDRITIRHLLRHSSGIMNYLQDPRFRAGHYFQGDQDSASALFFNSVSTDSMLRMFYTLPLEFDPGQSWAYSNTGYYILGKIAEAAGGDDFFHQVQEQVTGPLLMEHTMANEVAFADHCLSKGYFEKNNELVPSPYTLTSHYAFSAGAWATTGNDMILLLKAIHGKRLPSDKHKYDWRNLPDDNLPFTYEGGRFFSTYHGMRVISHNGGTPGFSSSWYYIVPKNISIIVLANRQDYAPIERLAQDILAYFEPTFTYPSEKLKTPEAKEYTGKLQQILQSLQNNKPLPGGLSAPLRKFLELENGKGMWQWFFSGRYPSAAYCVDKEMVNGSSVYRFIFPSGKTGYRLSMVVDHKNEITQVRWW